MTIVTAEFVAGIAGTILSLLFSYFPVLNTWFAAKSPVFKSLSMLGLVTLTAGGIFGLGCAGILTTNLVCTQQGAIEFLKVLGAALIANQSIFMIFPATSAVKAAKAG